MTDPSEADTRVVDLDDTETHPLRVHDFRLPALPEESTPDQDLPGEGGKTRTDAVFRWMEKKNCLWMLTEEYAGPIIEPIGHGRFFRIAGMRNRLYNDEHPALKPPKDSERRDRAYGELNKFLKTLPR